MVQTAPDHLDDVRRTGHVEPKIFLIKLMDQSLETVDQLLCVPALDEHDEIARFAVRRDEQSAPERTFQRVLKILRSRRQALDRTHSVNRVGLRGQSLNSLQISR